MKKIILVISLISLNSVVFAQFEDINIAKIKEVEVEGVSNPGLAIDTKSSRTYTNIWMSVYVNEAGKEIRGYDYSKRIEVDIRKIFDNEFNGSIMVDNKYEWVNPSKFGDSISFSNAGTYLNANKWGDNYSFSGNVKDEDGKYHYVNLTLYKRFSDEFSFVIQSGGIYLTFDRNSVNGDFDESQYPKKVIAYIISVVFTIEADTIK